MRSFYRLCVVATSALAVGCGTNEPPKRPVAVHGPNLLLPQPAGPVDQFGDGKYQIGSDLAPGEYKTMGPPDHNAKCYWARLKDFTGSVQSVIAMQYGNHGPDMAVIEPTDKGFETRDCGVWQRVAGTP